MKLHVSECPGRLLKYENETCPLVKKRCKKYQVPVKPWITRGLLKSIEEKNRLYAEYINSPTSNNETTFKSYKNHLTRLIRWAKKIHFEKLFLEAEGSSKKDLDNN